MKIKKLKEEHWCEIIIIYKDGIDTKNATFRAKVPKWKDWNENHHMHSRFVAIDKDEVIGWCAIAPVSKREAYKVVAEVSVYVSLDSSGKGVGGELIKKLIKLSEENGIWILYASLFPENIGSVKLHLKNEFRLIGVRGKITEQDGVWKDTVLYERRSKKF